MSCFFSEKVLCCQHGFASIAQSNCKLLVVTVGSCVKNPQVTTFRVRVKIPKASFRIWKVDLQVEPEISEMFPVKLIFGRRTHAFLQCGRLVDMAFLAVDSKWLTSNAWVPRISLVELDFNPAQRSNHTWHLTTHPQDREMGEFLALAEEDRWRNQQSH